MTLTTESATHEMVALNADVVGYSRLMADDFAATAAIVEGYHRLVEERVAASGGTLVVFVGDNFMAVFDQATDAMEAAIAISTEIEMRNQDVPQHRQVRFRMGIDQGRVTVTSDGQYFGEPLNIAARIQAIARPGGISVSGDVYRALDEPELRFRATGQQRLKNIPGSVQVYEFVDLPADAPPDRRQGRLGLAPPTVAVLPIHTETLDVSLGPAGSLLVAELVHRLSSIPRLKVVDATDEARREETPSTVQYMLETGIHQFGEEIRVYAHLRDVATINIVFSHRFDASPETLVSRFDELVNEVGRSVQIELVVGEPARLYAELGDPVALENVYRGWYHLNSLNRQGWLRAIEYFEEVERSHPEATYGYALLAFSHWMGAAERFTEDREKHFELAFEYARKGIALGDPTGMSQMVEAADLLSQGQFDLAMEKLEAVRITRPTCDVTYALAGSVRRYLGEWEKAVELIDRAIQLTQVVNPWYPTVQACSLFIGDRFEDASTTAETVLEHQPNNLEALLVLAAALAELGLDRRARATAQQVKERFPAINVEQWLRDQPYYHPELIDRWRRDLQQVGLITDT